MEIVIERGFIIPIATHNPPTFARIDLRLEKYTFPCHHTPNQRPPEGRRARFREPNRRRNTMQVCAKVCVVQFNFHSAQTVLYYWGNCRLSGKLNGEKCVFAFLGNADGIEASIDVLTILIYAMVAPSLRQLVSF